MRNAIVNIFIMALILVFAPIANANLLQNGDFEKGSRKWNGDDHIEYDPPNGTNHICKIELDEDKDFEFYQAVRTRKFKDLVLTFRIKKSYSYSGRGYQIRFVRNDQSYHFYDRTPPDHDEWEDVEITFSDIQRSTNIKIVFIVKSRNTGYLAFDDVMVIGK